MEQILEEFGESILAIIIGLAFMAVITVSYLGTSGNMIASVLGRLVG